MVITFGAAPHEPSLHVAKRITARAGQGLTELVALEKHWRTLEASLPRASFIHSYDWQYAYQKHLAPTPNDTHYFSFFENDRAIAIFPLCRVRRLVGRLALWLWELPVHPHLALADALLSPSHDAAELIERLIIKLNAPPHLSWNALHLPNLLEDSLTMRCRQVNKLRWSHLEKTGQSMHFICSDLATAIAQSTGAFKRNLRRQGRKLAQLGEVSLSIARHGEELDTAYAEFLRIEAAGWKGEHGKASAIALHPRLLAFYGELKARFAADDGCLISLLKLDGKAIAAQFCLISGSTLYVQKIAYDESYSAEAPGNQLMLRLLEYCCLQTSINRLSLVTGPAWAKGRWNPLSREVWEAYIFKPNLLGLGGLTMRSLKRQLPAWSLGSSRHF